MEPVEIIAVPVPSPVRSTSAEKRAEIQTKPISEQVFAMSVERKRDDHVSESTEVERQPVAKLRATSDPRLVEANPLIVVSGGADDEIGVEVEAMKEAVVTSVQVCHIDENNGCSSLTRHFHSGVT